MTVQFRNSFHTLLFVFLVDHVLASQIKTVEETLWVKPTPIWVNHLAPISCTQFKIRTAQHDSPVSETVFTLFSLFFFGGPRLSITDQDCGRDFMGEANSNLSQPFGIHLLYTIQDSFSSAWQSSSETVFTLFSLFFWWTMSWHHRSRLWKRLYGWNQLQFESTIWHPSLVHNSRFLQLSMTVQFRNSFHTLLFVFLVDHVLASQIKTVAETLWVKPTPIWVNHLSPISCTQFKIRTAQHDGPVSKTVFTLFSLFFGGPSLSTLDQDWGRDFVGKADSIAGQLLVAHLLYTV